MRTFLSAIGAGLLLLAIPALTSCSSTPKVDWTSRVGTFTYDQAVVELGPPDKMARTSDGLTVADWVMGQRQNSSVSIGTGFFSGGYHGGTGVGIGQTMGGGYSDRILRLTFGADNRLLTWWKN